MLNHKNSIKKYLKITFCLTFFLNISFSVQADRLTMLQKAEQEKSSRKYTKANYYYFKILSKNTNDEDALYGLAHSFFRLNQNVRALTEVNKLLDLNSSNEKALGLRAMINVQNQLWNNVLSDASHILEINPVNAQAYIYLDNAYTALGNQAAADEALKQYRQIKEMEKNINSDDL